MHIPGRENVNQQTDERDKARVNSRQPVHSETEIGAETADLNPRPKLVENRFIGMQRADVRRADAERNHKRDDTRHTDRRTGDDTAKKLVLQTPANQPVDYCTEQRRENY